MLVDQPGTVDPGMRPIENLAGVAHGKRQIRRLIERHASKEDGHSEGADLAFGD